MKSLPRSRCTLEMKPCCTTRPSSPRQPEHKTRHNTARLREKITNWYVSSTESQVSTYQGTMRLQSSLSAIPRPQISVPTIRATILVVPPQQSSSQAGRYPQSKSIAMKLTLNFKIKNASPCNARPSNHCNPLHFR